MPPLSAIALLALSSLAPLVTLRAEEFWYAVGVALSLTAARCLFPRSLPVLAGASLALLPCVGPHIIWVVLIGYLALSLTAIRTSELRWSGPALLFLLGTVMAEAWRALLAPGGAFFQGLAIDGPARVLDIVRAMIHTQASSWELLSRFTLFALLVSALGSRADERRSFSLGILFGMAVASLLALLYAAGADSLALRGQAEFWTEIRRVSSTLSDPNSLGLMAAIALWIAAFYPGRLPLPRLFWVAWGVQVVAAGLISGSRTFILSTALLCAALLWVRSRRLALTALAFAVGAFVALNLFATVAPDAYHGALALPLPEGLRRAILSLTVVEWESAFFSRTVFTQISLAMISEHPLYGVGANRYRDYIQLVSNQLALGLGSWSDNANNFYLGLLAELGLVGTAAVLWSLFSRRTALEGSALVRPALASFALVLLTGPHIEFPEVLAAGALLLATCTTAPHTGSSYSRVVAAVFFFLGMPAALVHERGVFAWKAEGATLSRWLSSSAGIEAVCPEPSGSPTVLTLQSGYIPSSGGLLVVAYEHGSQLAHTELRSTGAVNMSLPCTSPGPRLVDLRVTPPWSPYRAWPGRNSDRRIFGVRQIAAAQ